VRPDRSARAVSTERLRSGGGHRTTTRRLQEFSRARPTTTRARANKPQAAAACGQYGTIPRWENEKHGPPTTRPTTASRISGDDVNDAERCVQYGLAHDERVSPGRGTGSDDEPERSGHEAPARRTTRAIQWSPTTTRERYDTMATAVGRAGRGDRPATGCHVVFTNAVNAGVPPSDVEYILGEGCGFDRGSGARHSRTLDF